MLFEDSYILLLKGVFLKDCTDVEDFFENELMENISCDKTVLDISNTVLYNKIPSIFISKKRWIKETNLLCWYCDLSFDNIPIFIPNNISNNENGRFIEVYGNFCSFGCAQGYLNTQNKFSKYELWEKQKLLHILYKIFNNNKNIDVFFPSPSKYNLYIYGGTKPIKWFKEEINKIRELNNE